MRALLNMAGGLTTVAVIVFVFVEAVVVTRVGMALGRRAAPCGVGARSVGSGNGGDQIR